MIEDSETIVYDTSDYMRMHPDVFYGKIGDGTEYDDCIYLMLQDIINNSIDEFLFGYGKEVEISVNYVSGEMCVRDYGRGAPIKQLDRCFIAQHVAGMYSPNMMMDAIVHWTGGARKVCALSSCFQAVSIQDGNYGKLVAKGGKKFSYEIGEFGEDEKNGLLARWIPDATVLPKFIIVENHVVQRIKECAMTNPGLTFLLNGNEIVASNKGEQT